jgi:hypothetical protein
VDDDISMPIVSALRASLIIMRFIAIIAAALIES